ncbi:hypothetical protein ACN6AX_06310 [Paenibacillus polymyxa]
MSQRSEAQAAGRAEAACLKGQRSKPPVGAAHFFGRARSRLCEANSPGRAPAAVITKGGHASKRVLVNCGKTRNSQWKTRDAHYEPPPSSTQSYASDRLLRGPGGAAPWNPPC